MTVTPPSDNLDAAGAGPAAEDEQSFELPLPDEGAIEGRRLRRGLFGFKPSDVRTQISAKDAELAELRRDVAALWLAFGQHERTIRQVLETLERTSGVALDPPGGRAGEGQSPAPAESADAEAGADDSVAASIGAQLSDLDEVLAAIEQATQTLERGYSEGGGTTEDQAPENEDDEIETEPTSEPEPEPEPGPG